MKKKFDKWNEIKKITHDVNVNRNFSEREIRFLKMGTNIGFEQDGKGGEFLRPALVIKKFNKFVFLGVPLTKKSKKTRFYCEFNFQGKISVAILSQVRLFDTKRLKFRIGKINKYDFDNIKQKLTVLIQ